MGIHSAQVRRASVQDYEALCEKLKDISTLSGISGLLGCALLSKTVTSLAAFANLIVT